MAIREFWRRLTTTRYARALEFELAGCRAEIQRLRTENRALLNSILGIAGIPPVLVDHGFSLDTAKNVPGGAVSFTRGRAEHSSAQRYGADEARNENLNSAVREVATPLRRRSWHQISRIFEFESARKAVASD